MRPEEEKKFLPASSSENNNMHTENYNKQKIAIVTLLSFFLGFFDGFLIYILSEYFALVSGSANVGIFYFVAYSFVLGLLFYLQSLVRKIGQARALYLSLGVTILAAAFLTRLEASWVTIGLMIFFITATNITWVTLDMILESFSQDRRSGRIRGIYLSIMSAGILLAPFLSTWTLEKYQYQGIFFILLLGYIGIFLVALLSFRHDNVVPQVRHKLFDTVRKVWRENNLFHIYFVSFSLEFFYALMLVYTPLYLRSLGFAWTDIGIIFTIMLIPFVLLQYPLGRLADRQMGEKELLAGCIVIALLSTLVIPFLESPSVLVWGMVLFFTRVGISGIEVLRDSYFYKQIDHADLDVIAFFRTTRPVANILGAAVAFMFLLFFHLQAIFFVVVLVFLLSLSSVARLRDTCSEAEISPREPEGTAC